MSDIIRLTKKQHRENIITKIVTCIISANDVSVSRMFESQNSELYLEVVMKKANILADMIIKVENNPPETNSEN